MTKVILDQKVDHFILALQEVRDSVGAPPASFCKRLIQNFFDFATETEYLGDLKFDEGLFKDNIKELFNVFLIKEDTKYQLSEFILMAYNGHFYKDNADVDSISEEEFIAKLKIVFG